MAYDTLQRSPEQSRVLDRVLERAREVGAEGVAVLDLDGTLFDTRPRQVAIVRAFAAAHGVAALDAVRVEHFVDWSLGRTLANAGLSPSQVHEIRPVLLPFWEARFFDGDWLVHDPALPGAPDYVHALADAGLTLVYLTGRHTPMRAGSEAALRREGFPFGGRHHLLVKPQMSDDDTLFKDRALEHIAHLGRPTLFFDNEPANVNLFFGRHPDATVVFLDTDHSFRPDRPDPAIPRIRGFLR